MTTMKTYLVRRATGCAAGPFSADTLRQMARSGLLSRDSEVCSSDAASWYPITHVPELLAILPTESVLTLESESSISVVALPDTPTSKNAELRFDADASFPSHVSPLSTLDNAVPNQTGPNTSHGTSVVTTLHETTVPLQVPRPWVRFWARQFDLWLFGLSAGFVIGFTLGLISPTAANEITQTPAASLALGVVITFLWVFCESLLLAIFGTTPGKWLLSTRVVCQNRYELPLSTTFARSIYVWAGGIGFGIPIVALITQLISYSRLTAKQSTWWDDKCGSVVVHSRIGALRIAAFCLGYGTLLCAYVLLSSSTNRI